MTLSETPVGPLDVLRAKACSPEVSEGLLPGSEDIMKRFGVVLVVLFRIKGSSFIELL
jgi:hypothetical protein